MEILFAVAAKMIPQSIKISAGRDFPLILPSSFIINTFYEFTRAVEYI